MSLVQRFGIIRKAKSVFYNSNIAKALFLPKAIYVIGAAMAAAGCQPAPISTVIAIDAPPTPPNGEFGTQITLPGVALTDQLIVSPTQSFGTWGIYHHSPGFVMVNYNNTTGVIQDPPPITFRVTYIRF